MHARYTGTIHPDITKQYVIRALQILSSEYAETDFLIAFSSFSEWITHQHRDTSASIIGHPSLLSYLAVAEGESRARVKFELCQVSKFALTPFIFVSRMT